MEKEAKVRFDNALIDSLYFNYLEVEEKNDIKARMHIDASIACEFIVNDNIVFCVIYDLEYATGYLHIRELGGMFDRKEFSIIEGFKLLNHFSAGFAKAANLDKISFKDGNRAVYKKLNDYVGFGFEPVNGNEFERRIH